jgi:hypothetical protein
VTRRRNDLVVGSLAWSVVEYFRANIDEELLTEDIAIRWDVPVNRRVPQTLQGAVACGLLACRQENRASGGGYRNVYSAGPMLLALSREAA